MVLPKMRSVFVKFPQIETSLSGLLSQIKEKRIVVVESGCTGTFPLLLKSLDNRIEIRMYTTYPYLFSAFKDKIFTTEFEKNQLFETLYSQDLYFKFSDFKDGKYYVNTCSDSEVREKAFAK
ncbi:MAG: hypothetical protein ACI4MN_03800 [Candidatus Coproplasma sp.]